MKTVPNPCVLRAISGGGPTGSEIIAEAGGIGAGTAAARIISSAGGMAAVAEGSALAVGAAAWARVAASAVAGYQAGTFLYNNSQTVQRGAGWVVGGIMDAVKEVGSMFQDTTSSAYGQAGTDANVLAPPKKK